MKKYLLLWFLLLLFSVNAWPQKVRAVSREVNVAGNGFDYTFPAHSFTQLRIKIN